MCEPGQIGYRRKMPQRAEHPLPTADGPRGRPGRRVRAHAALAATLPLVLAGCTGAPGPTGPGPTTARNHGTVATASPISPSPTEEKPAVAAPERPVAMDRLDADGAVAAARYFVSLYPYVYATGDLAQWKAMSDPACIFCGSVINNVEKMKALGHTSKGPSVSITAVKNASTTPGREVFTIELHLEQGPSIEFDSSGAVVSRVDKSKSLNLVIADSHSGPTWIVREISANEVTG
jgi:hypothetical protein